MIGNMWQCWLEYLLSEMLFVIDLSSCREANPSLRPHLRMRQSLQSKLLPKPFQSEILSWGSVCQCEEAGKGNPPDVGPSLFSQKPFLSPQGITSHTSSANKTVVAQDALLCVSSPSVTFPVYDRELQLHTECL